jgi:hypothetical protein
MKYILFLFLPLMGSLYACEGDCLFCHPKLVKEGGHLDKDHAVLTSCKTCHTQEEMAKIDMGSGCGQDCWECHDIKKVTQSQVPQHQGLQKCIDCHLTLDKNLFGGGTLDPFVATPTLSDFLNKEKSVASNNTDPIPQKITQRSSREEESSFWEDLLDFLSSLWQKLRTIFN